MGRWDAFGYSLRHRLPESLDHMLASIYTAYSMMARSSKDEVVDNKGSAKDSQHLDTES